MLPIKLGKITISDKKKSYHLKMKGVNKKFDSKKDAVDASYEEIKRVVGNEKVSSSIKIYNADKATTSILEVTSSNGKHEPVIMSHAYYAQKYRKYYSAGKIETMIPMGKVNGNTLARTNFAKARKFKYLFYFLTLAMGISAIMMFIFSTLKLNGYDMNKRVILVQLMKGDHDNDMANIILSLISFLLSIVMLSSSIYIAILKKEVRKDGIFYNNKWSRIYIVNLIRQRVVIFLLIISLAMSIAQVSLLHNSYAAHIQNEWWVAKGVIVMSILELITITTFLATRIITVIYLQAILVKRLKSVLNVSYIQFVKSAFGRYQGKSVKTIEDKKHVVSVSGIKTEFATEEQHKSTVVLALPSNKRVRIYRRRMMAQRKRLYKN